MGRRQMFLLLLLICAFASFVSASSVTFLDEWGDAASRVLENTKVRLRVTDPAANTTSGRDWVEVDLASDIALDTGFANLEETGEGTGVFEGEVDLTTDYYLNYLEDESHLRTEVRSEPPLDTATATYAGVSDTVEAAPSLTDLLDEAGASPAAFAVGEAVRVRVRDRHADRRAGPDSAMATLTTSGGDSESLVLPETGGRTHVFEVSLPSAAGAPVPGDGRIQAAAGQTLSVTHPDRNGFSSSSDSAAFTASSVRLVDRAGRPTDVYLEDSEVIARVVDLAADTDPYTFQTVSATAAMQLTGDTETLTLRETGRNTGVFEGAIDMSIGYPSSGDQRLESQPVASATSPFDAVTISYGSVSDGAVLTGSVTRLFDEDGEAAPAFALGTRVLIRVETANDSPFVDDTTVEVRSLASGDVETVRLLETGPATNVFEGTVLLLASTASPGDGYVDGDPGDTLRVDHPDANGFTRSRAEGTLARSSVRFVDAEGNTTPVVLERGLARVRVTDLLSASQPEPPAASVSARLTHDSEPLALAEVPGTSIRFEGSVLLTDSYSAPDDGLLGTMRTANPVNEPDTLTATSNDATAQAVTAPAILEFVDAQGEPQATAAAGSLLRVRAVSALANSTPYPNTLVAVIGSYRGEWSQYLLLTETGGATGIFEGTVQTTTGSPSGGKLRVASSDRVTVVYDADSSTYDDTRETSALIEIVPSTVELVDGAGAAVSSYLFAEPIHVRVTDPAANLSPGLPESAVATVQAWRRGDDRPDVEIAFLTETGPDTGVFEGSLPSVLIAPSATPAQGDGDLQLLDVYPPYGDLATITATRGTATDTARMEDSRLRITNAAGEDSILFPIGSEGHVWLQRPAGNTTPGVDTEQVQVWNSEGFASDFEILTLTETGGDTGIFTGSIPVAMGSFNSDDGILQGQPGATVHVEKIVTVTVRSFDSGLIALVLFHSPEAVDDSAATAEGTPVTVNVTANDTDFDGDDLGVVAVTQGSKGSVTFTPGGDTVTYTPNPGATGSDSFTYTVSDFSGLVDGNTDTATVFVTIATLNGPPNAVDDSAATLEDTPVNVAVKANDSDPDNDPLTVTSATQGTFGSTAVQPDGTVTYTPYLNFYGTDTFTYTLSDGTGGAGSTDTAAVAITVSAVNDPPFAANDSVTTNEDTAVNFPVKSNDGDPEGDPLSVTSVTQGSKGSVVINQSPGALHWLIYTPNANANGSDTFTYTISDGHGGTATGTVSVTITPVNDVPKAFADSVATNEDTPLTFDPRINDTDADGDTLTITSASDPNRGSTAVNANGTAITYTPDANLNGTDSFVYSISDGHGGTWSALVTVTVTAVNDVPDARNDLPLTNEDTPITLNVLSNDVDPDGDALTVTAVTQPAKGTAAINANNTITYTPNLNANGSDSFTYTISDGHGGGDTATVSLTVAPVNDPPVAVTDTATVAEEGTVTVAVAANDTDAENSALTVTAVTQGAHGTVTLLAGNQVRYQPAMNWFGPDSFTYTVRDPGNLTAVGTVNVTVTDVNDAPVANPDTAATNEDVPIAISVLANDADVDGNPLVVTAVTQGANGAVTSNGTTVTYTPAANFSGGDAFTYTLSDGAGGTATAAVTVSIAAVNDAPNAAPDSAATREGVAVVIPVLANDTDVEGNSVTVTAVGTPAVGSAVLLADGTVSYTPTANFTGSVAFSYTASDGQAASAGQVTVTVGEALERVAILATNSVAIRTGADVLSGDVIVNQATAGPYLNGAALSVAGTVTTPANWDVEGDTLTIAAGSTIGGDVSYNQLTNSGTINGLQRSPLALPVFSTLPAFLTATPGAITINVPNNGTQTLAAGSYLDLVVGRKGTVTFTGGVYHFRTITVDREAKLLFSAASEVRVQQKLSTKTQTTIGPAAGASIDASSILFHVAGVNGTTGGLTATPKAVDIGSNNIIALNLYAPNGTTLIQDGTAATGAFLGKDIDVGLNVQVTLDSAY